MVQLPCQCDVKWPSYEMQILKPSQMCNHNLTQLPWTVYPCHLCLFVISNYWLNRSRGASPINTNIFAWLTDNVAPFISWMLRVWVLKLHLWSASRVWEFLHWPLHFQNELVQTEENHRYCPASARSSFPLAGTTLHSTDRIAQM